MTSVQRFRASTIRVTAQVSAATPTPIVVAAATPLSRFAPCPPIVRRGTLQDPPVLTTPAPVVVAQPVVLRPVGPPILSRSSLVDVVPPPLAVVPSPIVVVPVPSRRWPTQAIILRSTLADPPVLTTPRPIVIAAPRWRDLTYPIISVAPFILPPSEIPKASRIEPGTRAFAGNEPGLRAGPGIQPGMSGSAANVAGGKTSAQAEPGTRTGPSIEGGG